MSGYSINLLLGTTYPFNIENAIHLPLTQLARPITKDTLVLYSDQISFLGYDITKLPQGRYYLSNGSYFEWGINPQPEESYDQVYFGDFHYLDKTTGKYVGSTALTGISFGMTRDRYFLSFFIDAYNGQGNIDDKTGYLYSLNPSNSFGIIDIFHLDPLNYNFNTFYFPDKDGSSFTKEFITNFFDGALYEQGPRYPSSDTDVGIGNFDNSSDDIDFPQLPTVDILGTGFVRAYQPTQEQLIELSNYLWSDAFSLDTLKKLFADPMESLIGLSMIPVTPTVAENQNILFGNITTDITANKILSQYVIFDCGEITLDEYFGSSLDYDPYTHIDIYLPFINTQTLNTNDVMGAKLHLKYYIDVVTGSCVALLKVSKSNLNSVIYSWNGNCIMQIPVSASDNSSYLQSVLGITASLATTAVTAYATKGASLAAGVGAEGAKVGASIGSAALAGSVVGLATNVAGSVSQMHTTVQRGGTMSGNLGFISTLRPYLMITRPKQCFPRNFNTFEGQPSYVTGTIGNLSGYTKVYSVHLQNITATVEELNEIETLLKNGIIL